MIQNVVRKVKHYRLSKVKGYYAIFEAVSNSIDSYKGDFTNAPITVAFQKVSDELDLGSEAADSRRYREVTVRDLGEGFTSANYDSFNTSDSDLKEDQGGKGLGRFSWLKVFDSVKIESHFEENEKLRRRSFEFIRSKEGINNHSVSDSSTTRTGTLVRLIDQRKEWEIPKKIQTFAEKLIEHFLPTFLSEKSPQFLLIDNNTDDKIDVNLYFKENYRGKIDETEFEVKGQKFHLSIHKTKIGNSNQLIFVANGRSSKTVNLSKYLIDLNAELSDAEGKFFVVSFLTGDYLDESVSPERDDFTFDSEVTDDEISFADLNQTAVAYIEKLIEPILTEIQERKQARIAEYVSDRGPEYRYLLAENPGILKTISPTASEREIEASLHGAEIEFKARTSKVIEKILASDEVDLKAIDEAYEKVSEAAKADLTKYILWRDRVILLLEKKMSWDERSKFDKEEELHKLFYQMKVTSSDVPIESNNLWLIDERLNFHDYLASDLALDGKNGDRPDIFSYNVPHYFNNLESPSESFTIVEFKRPMRNDYTDDDNPLDQVDGYIEQIRAGKARRKDGQMISLPASTPCFAYIVCDLTSKMRSLCNRRGYIETYDSLAYFFYNPVFRSYTEVLSYQHIAKEARNRNRIFMKKIGLK